MKFGIRLEFEILGNLGLSWSAAPEGQPESAKTHNTWLSEVTSVF